MLPGRAAFLVVLCIFFGSLFVPAMAGDARVIHMAVSPLPHGFQVDWSVDRSDVRLVEIHASNRTGFEPSEGTVVDSRAVRHGPVAGSAGYPFFEPGETQYVRVLAYFPDGTALVTPEAVVTPCRSGGEEGACTGHFSDIPEIVDFKRHVRVAWTPVPAHHSSDLDRYEVRVARDASGFQEGTVATVPPDASTELRIPIEEFPFMSGYLRITALHENGSSIHSQWGAFRHLGLNRAPTASLHFESHQASSGWFGPYIQISPGEQIIVNATGSIDPDGDALTFRWMWGDGTTTEQGDIRETHFYNEPGTYQVYVEAVDADGAASRPPASAWIEVKEAVQPARDLPMVEPIMVALGIAAVGMLARRKTE